MISSIFYLKMASRILQEEAQKAAALSLSRLDFELVFLTGMRQLFRSAGVESGREVASYTVVRLGKEILKKF